MIPLSDTELSDVVTRLAHAHGQMTQWREQVDALKTVLRACGPMARREIAGVHISVTDNRRFDIRRAQGVLTPQQYAAICIAKPDPVVAREVLPPDTYDACLTAGELTVRLT